MKKWVCTLLMLVLMLPTCVVSANAEKAVFVNGEQMELPAVEIDGEWMIPLRPVAEALGYDVIWVEYAQNHRCVVVENREGKTEIQIDKSYIVEYDKNYREKAVFAFAQILANIHNEMVYVSAECLQNVFSVVIRTNDAVRIVTVFDSVEDYAYGFSVVERDGKYGYVGIDGKVAIPCIFDSAMPFRGEFAVVQKNGKYGTIDKTAEVVVPFEYDSVTLYLDGYAIVEKDDMYGVANQAGEILLPIVYPTKGYDFPLYIKAANKGIAIDEKGMPVMPFPYENIQDLSANLYTFCYEGKVGLLDKDFKLITPPTYDTIRQNYNEWWYDDMIGVKQNGKYGMIDGKTGELVIPCEYDFWMQFYENDYAVAAKDGVYGVINRAAEAVIPFVYDDLDASYNNDGIYIAKKDGGYGLINSDNKEIQPFMYERVFEFGIGAFLVKKNGKLGVISTSGETIIPICYDEIGKYLYGIRLKADDKYGVADKDGNIVIPVIYDDISYMAESLYVKQGDKSGVIASDGRIVIPLQ